MFILPTITLLILSLSISAFSELNLINKTVNFSSNDSTLSVNEINSCAEDRLEALEVGRLCSRRCRKDVPCENARKQCLCDGLCGMSCIKPDLNCADLPKIEHGDYYPKSSRFGVKISYFCEQGYYLFGSRERICQGDEEWSGTAAECTPEPQCNNPMRVNHARNPVDGVYRLHDKVNYSCYPGYQSRGSPEAVCKLIKRNQTAWSWSGDPFRCVPKSCGDPGQIENGKRIGDSFIVASSVLYTCREGFDMIGQERRYCQSDNQWSGQAPRCEPITCNPTDHLENGKINYNYPLVFNSSVKYECDSGFQLVGQQVRRCGHERKLLGDVPTCVEIDCGELGPLHNGYIRGFSNRMGDRKEFVCNEGTKFVGEQRDSICLESGHWSHPLPKCLGPCVVPHIEHATQVYIVREDLLMDNSTELALDPVDANSLATHGSYLEIFCEKYYEVEEQVDENNLIRAPVCNNSTWSYRPKCKPASCRLTPPSPKNGRVRIASIEHGARGFIQCLDGYRLKGDRYVQCNKGKWTDVNASCNEIYCGFPGIIEHGRVQLIGLTGMYDYKPYIKRISTNRQIAYECDPGYRLSDGAPNGATCMDGQWRPEGLPTCVKE